MIKMSNPFDSAWALLKGINPDEEITGPSGDDLAPRMKQNQVYNSIPSMKQGAGISYYTNQLPVQVGLNWANSLYQVPSEQQYYSQMLRDLNHHLMERGETVYDINNMPATLSPEQIMQLQNEYKQIVPTEHQMPTHEEMPELILQNKTRNRQQFIDAHKKRAALRREREKGPENIFARKRD